MEGWIFSAIFLVAIVILAIKLNKKNYLDKSEKDRLQKEVFQLKQEEVNLYKEIDNLNNQSNIAIERYNNSVRDKTEELENYFALQKKRRQQILDEDFELQEKRRKESLDARMAVMVQQAQEKVNEAEKNANDQIEEWQRKQSEVAEAISLEIQRYEGLIAPIRQLEKDKQDRLSYTIQVPDEYKEDIEFLITTVSQKIQHPDIINKLVWAEYVKPYIAETFKRADIREESGIYKITNIDSGKAYIGKSTNIKKRLTDHFKSAIGISGIADQAVHHEIQKTGFWNWMIEPIVYCDKDKLNEMEKYYIDFFKTQEFGFNRNVGGGG